MSTATEPATPDRKTMLLSVDDVTEELGVSRSQTYKYLRTNELRSVHIGRRRLIRRSDLEAFVHQLTESGLDAD